VAYDNCVSHTVGDALPIQCGDRQTSYPNGEYGSSKMKRRLLFVDDEPAIRMSLAAVLTKHDFEVTTAATVAEALQHITSTTFDILLSDLNIGNPGDGLTVVSAMRRTQPDAVTMILTGYPAFETALEAIRQQVDDYIVKPASIPTLLQTLESKLATPSQQRHLPPPKRVAMLLQEHIDRVEELWVSAVQNDHALSQLPLSREQRLSYLREVLEEVIGAAQTYSGEQVPKSIHPPGGDTSLHHYEGHASSTLLAEFCLLRKTLAQVVQENLLAVNLSYVVPDLARVNENLDEQIQAALSSLTVQDGLK
jgi:ActR/RegA family two-component response regulator